MFLHRLVAYPARMANLEFGMIFIQETRHLNRLTSMRILPCLLPSFFFLLLSCQEKESAPQKLESRNPTMPHLPVASGALKIQGEQIHFIELQHSYQGWNVNGGNVKDDLEEVEEEINHAKQNIAAQGYSPLILIEADGDTPFKKIRAIIRASARAGVDQILFAARQHEMHPNSLEHALPLHLHPTLGCRSTPCISPLFIKCARDGNIYINTGPAQELLDTDIQSRSMPILDARMDSYCVVARSAAQQTRIQIWIDGEAPYQRFIDLINMLRNHGIENEQWVDLFGYDSEVTCGGMRGCGRASPIPPRRPRAPSMRNPLLK